VSWPSDGLPRFKVIAHAGEGHSKLRATAYILDRADCHREVTRAGALTVIGARAKLEAIAATLEAGGDWPPPRKSRGVTHGTSSGYKHFGCRCNPCVEARRVWERAYRARKRSKAEASA
jgi:hypothetical protein